MSTTSDISTPPASAAELEGNVEATIEKDSVLCWRNLTVDTKRKIEKSKFWSRQRSETHVIIDNVTGYARSGRLTAIMGASGAGKTTLLATISHRVKIPSKGEIVVNGGIVSGQLMARLSGFVPQQDLFYKSLTVMEHMEFMARLKMDQRARRIHRNRRIYCLLSELGLLRCGHTRLGSLSGGELKRLSLAVQLLTDPLFLFCDEPTTGLDSYSAGVVLEHLRHCAERGKAVICSIHQPASGHFDLFHDVLLLAGGRVAYCGPVVDTCAYFNSVGLVCPPTYNPPEFYVQQLAILPGKEAESQSRNQWLCDAFIKSPRGQEVAFIINQEFNRRSYNAHFPRDMFKESWSTHSSTTTESILEVEATIEFHKYLSIVKPSEMSQLYWLIWRSFKDMSRNSANIFLRFFLFMLIAVLISTPYINVATDLTQNTIQNMQGFMYLVVTEVVFTFSYSVFHTFPAEIPILLRELSNGLYEPGPYYISKMFIIFVRSVIESSLYAAFIFWIVALPGGSSGLFFFCLPIVFAALSATAYGCLMSAAFESVDTASLISVPLEMLAVMFCGLYLQLSNLPDYLSWMKYLSQFYYGQEAVSITQWSMVDRIECPDNPTMPCIANGEGVLNKYGYSIDNYATDLFGLGSFYCAAHILGFISLWRRSCQQPIY